MHAPSNAASMVPDAAKSEPGSRHPFPVALFRVGLTIGCLLLVGVLGYLDYRTGYEQSLLLFYLVPIALATWFEGLVFGLIFSVISVAAWVASDVFAGIPRVGFWNLGMASAAYAVFAVLLSKLRTLLGDLEDRVRERT